MFHTRFFFSSITEPESAYEVHGAMPAFDNTRIRYCSFPQKTWSYREKTGRVNKI